METIDIRLPDISADNDTDQLRQIRSYLYQLAGQLQFALGDVSARAELAQQQAVTANTTAVAAQQGKPPVSTFESIKQLIIESADIVEQYADKIDERLEGRYVAMSEIGTVIEETYLEIEGDPTKIVTMFEQISTILQNTSNSIAEIEDSIADINAAVDNVDKAVQTINASITTGNLGGDEYGVEIKVVKQEGDTTTEQKLCRLTSGALTFFDADGNAVATFAENTMYAPSGTIDSLISKEVTIGNQLNLGDYVLGLTGNNHLTLM